MDLKSGCMYWSQVDGEAPRHPPLRDDRACDVAVVGGGVTGAAVSHFLVSAGMRVVALDRRDVAQGSTGASTGLLQYEIDRPLVELKELVGEAAAVRSYRLGVETFEKFRQIIAEIGDDCGYRPRTSLWCATEQEHVPLLHEECKARRAAGIRVDFLSEREIGERFSFRRPAALLSHDAAEVDPYRLTARLIEHAVSRGLEVYGGTEVVRYDAGADGVTLVTDAGCRVRAEHVVFATGYETPEFLGALDVKLKSTYALASA
jgi:glycine/D-amino acid oxidase-like deaminating enzyme